MFRRGAAEALAGLLVAGLLFAVLFVAIAQRNRLAAVSSSPQASTTHKPASGAVHISPSAVVTPAATPVPTPAPTPTPTAQPTHQAAPAPPARCSASDLTSHNGAVHGMPYTGDLNSPIPHPGDRMLITGYVSFTRAARGCVLPPSTARLFVLDPSGSPVTWWTGMSVRWPQMVGGGPSGCGCQLPAPVAASVLWMCGSAGNCAGTPLGDYTLVLTVTLDDGTIVTKATLAMPTSSPPTPSPSA